MDFHAWGATLSHLPVDWIIIAVCAVVIAADALRSGTRRGIAISLAFPIASILYGSMAQTVLLGNIFKTVSFPLEQNLLVIAIVVIFFVLLSRIIGSSWAASAGLMQAFLTGAAATVVIVIFWLQLAPLQALWHFGSPVQAVFGEAYRFWWLMCAYAVLAFVRG